jgi:D-alanine-D-alanine ligase
MKVAVVFDTPHAGWEDADFRREMAAGVEEAEYEVAQALISLGHEVRLIGIRSDVEALLDQLRAFCPDIVFNCAESFDGNPALDYVFPALLEAGGYRYTGSPPVALLTTRNKAMSKKVLAYHGVQVPRFRTYRLGEAVDDVPDLRFPVIVKPLFEDASVGIAGASVARCVEEAAARVAYVHERFRQPAIAEEFVDGRELYVGLLGNGPGLTILPIVEMVWDKRRTRPEERIATRLAKWDPAYRERKGIRNVFARPIPRAARQRIAAICAIAHRALWLRDYARLDLRLTAEGDVWVIEANANPFISFGHDMANAAEKAGLDYPAFIQRIVDEALRRYDRQP